MKLSVTGAERKALQVELAKFWEKFKEDPHAE